MAHHKFNKGDEVSWKWGRGKAKGTIEEVYTSRVTKKIKNKFITRNATPEEPAYLISVSNNGGVALKSESNLNE